jgi:putative peptidoglycan lipid II flippase
MGMAIGTVVGALGHLLIQLPGLVQQRAQYRPLLTVRDPGVLKVLRLMAPRVLGLSFSEINKFIMLYLTGSMPLGSLPALNAAFRLIIFPQGILGQALGIAAFPTLSTLAAREAFAEMRSIITDSLRLLLYLGLPVTLWLALLRREIVTVLFERGLFGAESTALVSAALLFMAFGLLALMLLEVIARSFYALSDTLTPVLAGGLQVALMAALSLLLLNQVFIPNGWLPLSALALAFSLSNFAEVILLLWLLRRKLGRLNGRDLASGAWRMLSAAALMGVVTWATASSLGDRSPWIILLMAAPAGGAAYFAGCQILRVREQRQVIRLASARLSR